MITWRPYQTEIINSVFDGWKTYSNLLVVAATGAGKTNCLWGVADRFLHEHPAARIMVLAHRKELIEQPKDRLLQFWPERSNQVGIVMADQDEFDKQIVIATVQTVGNHTGKRINQVLRHGPIDLLIIDEAHHAAAQTYRNVIDRLDLLNPRLKVVGFTATPKRGDRKNLTDVFEHEASNVGVRRLINEGHLSDVIVEGVTTDLDLTGVAVQGSGEGRDYNQKQLNAAVDASNCYEKVIETHVNFIGDKPTIAFTASVAGAYNLAAQLREVGVKAVAADANTPKLERQAMLDQFSAGNITTLVNVGLWTEGLDLPSIEFCHLVRPTKSDSLWLQMAGRALRNSPGKEIAHIYDYQPVGGRDIEQRLEEMGIKEPGVKWGGGEGQPKDVKAGEGIEYIILDYFSERKEAWTEVGGWNIVGLGKGDDNIDRSMAVSPDGTELWAIWRKDGQRWNQAALLQSGSFDEIKKASAALVKKHGSKSLIQRAAPWRDRMPSEKMEKFGRNLKVFDSEMTAGELSDAINQKLVMQAIKRNRTDRVVKEVNLNDDEMLIEHAVAVLGAEVSEQRVAA